MATASFKSTTRRAGVGAVDDSRSSGSAGAYRRSRSLSRGPGRFRPAEGDDEPAAAPSLGRFVNTVRGSGFPEISLDDLADEFFTGGDIEEDLEREKGGGRRGRRLSDASFLMDTESSRRRGRSVSRKGNSFHTGIEVRGGFDSSTRRRHSLSVARIRCSDSESESDLSCNLSARTKLRTVENGNHLLPTSQKTYNPAQALRRSCSQKDFGQLQHSHSRFSSTLTDDESNHICTKKSGYEKAACAILDKKTDHSVGDKEGRTYETMHKGITHAADGIITELGKVIVKTQPPTQDDDNNCQPEGSEVVHTIAEIRRNYTTKLEESEKRRQELLAELAAEELRSQELTRIVKELLPGTKQTLPGKSSRSRRRSNDRSRMSKHLTEDAEKYIEDFISSIEDTDISSFDGERSDESSTIGGSIKSSARSEGQARLMKPVSSPVENDGLVLPWLKWEANNDGTPLSFKSKVAHYGMYESVYSKSSRGSWSPCDDSHSVISKDKPSIRVGETGCYSNRDTNKMTSSLISFDMDEYVHLQYCEDFVFEGLRQRQRIESGGLLLCGRHFAGL